jgi:YVTN family beta-propeller protein
MRSISALLITTLFVAACKKDSKIPEYADNPIKNGLLVLNEGLFQQNNSSISWVNLDVEKVQPDVFMDKNGRLLGDVGNDFLLYGGKLYVVVNNSNSIEVLDRATLKSVKQISMFDGFKGKQPRNLAHFDGLVYVTCFDGYVDVLDTATLTITKRIKVGHNPEDIVSSSGRLFVSNSGGLNYPDVDSTVSVIDIKTKSEIARITVGKNPGPMEVDSEGNIYVIARGNYSSIPSRLHRIHPVNLTLNSYPFDASGVTRVNHDLLIHAYSYSNQTKSLKLFSVATQTLSANNFLNVNAFQTIYSVNYCDQTKKLYITDAMDYTTTGYVRQFSVEGVFEKSYHVGLNPSKVLYLP